MQRVAQWSLSVAVAVMPLYVLRWRIGPLPTTLLEALVLLTIGLYVLAVLMRRAALPGRTPLDIPIVLFLLAGVIGVFVAPDHRAAIGIFRAYLLEPVAMFYVASALLTARDAVDRLMATWAVGSSLFALGQVAVIGWAVATDRLVLGHAASVFGINPNSVAIYLEPLIGLGTGLALFERGWRRRVALAVIVVLLAGDLATLSRGAILALGGLAFVAILTLRGVWTKIAVFAAAAAGSVALTQAPLIGERLRHALDPGHGTFDVRGEIWAATARMLRDRPVFGAGINAYQTTMIPYRRLYPTLSPEPYPHNIFLTAWTELGLLGLLSFSYIVAALIVMPFRALSRVHPASKSILWGTGAAFIMILAHGLVDSPYWKNDLSLEFWIMAALEIVALRGFYVADRPK